MKKWIVGGVLLALLAVWTTRFLYLNTHTPLPQEIYYDMEETVAYEKDFFNRADEDFDGYSIVVHRAAVYSYEEYLEKMNISPGASSAAPTYVYDIEVTVYNDDNENENGYIDLFNTMLIRSSLSMKVNLDLWDALYPALAGAAGFRLRPHTQMDFHFPFAAETPYERQAVSSAYLHDTTFYLCLTAYPNKKMVRVKAGV